MEHDPFCTCSVGDCLIICPVGCVCDCQFIAKVRADEREQAAQRVAALPPIGDIGDPWYSNAVSITKAIAAARGGGQW